MAVLFACRLQTDLCNLKGRSMRRAGGYRGWSAQQLLHISEEISKTSIKPITGCKSPLPDMVVLWHFNLGISSSDLTGGVLPGVPAWWPLPMSCWQVWHWITVVSLGTMCQKGEAGGCWLSPSLRDQQQLLFPGLEQCRACRNHAWWKCFLTRNSKSRACRCSSGFTSPLKCSFSEWGTKHDWEVDSAWGCSAAAFPFLSRLWGSPGSIAHGRSHSLLPLCCTHQGCAVPLPIGGLATGQGTRGSHTRCAQKHGVFQTWPAWQYVLSFFFRERIRYFSSFYHRSFLMTSEEPSSHCWFCRLSYESMMPRSHPSLHVITLWARCLLSPQIPNKCCIYEVREADIKYRREVNASWGNAVITEFSDSRKASIFLPAALCYSFIWTWLLEAARRHRKQSCLGCSECSSGGSVQPVGHRSTRSCCPEGQGKVLSRTSLMCSHTVLLLGASKREQLSEQTYLHLLHPPLVTLCPASGFCGYHSVGLDYSSGFHWGNSTAQPECWGAPCGPGGFAAELIDQWVQITFTYKLRVEDSLLCAFTEEMSAALAA